nr:MAG TPA: hypothetical protein [Caudoviricetes sp.]
MLRKRTEELTENGAVFIVETFLNAAGEEKGRTKYPKPSAETPEPAQETLTEQEQAILDTAINVDYLVCMKELEI